MLNGPTLKSLKDSNLRFFFNSDAYFKNTVLTKSYHMIDEDDPIAWEGYSVTVLQFFFAYTSYDYI